MSYRGYSQFALLLFCLSHLGFAEARSYKVELIAFQQQAPNSELFVAEEVPVAARYAQVAKGSKSLQYIVNNLKNAKGMRPFYYQSWRIAVSGGRTSFPIDVSVVGKPLKGWIKLQRGELLHVLADLEFNSGEMSYRLKEKRRVLLKEVHYLDHPKFGAIIKVSPL
ncbi:MAG: hypothetical protein GQ582_04105 [Methyloprofundus sp.]|nr:hypothetical protein [Methyloprofundus sp.]